MFEKPISIKILVDFNVFMEFNETLLYIEVITIKNNRGKSCTKTKQSSAKIADKALLSLLVNKNSSLRRVTPMNHNAANHAVMPKKVFATMVTETETVKCSQLSAQIVALIAKFPSNHAMVAQFTAAIASEK